MRVDAARAVLAVAVGLALAGGLAACGSDDKDQKEPPVPPTKLTANLSAGSDVNPSVTGAASPLFIRLYELKSETAFATAGFFALWDNEDRTLGKDLVNRTELVLSPGQKTKWERALAGDTRSLGIAAAYQNVEGARWRAIQAVPQHETTTLSVSFGRDAVAIMVEKPETPAAGDKPSEKKGGK